MVMGACDPCRKARSRCDQVSPSCKNCLKKNRPCTYIDFVKRDNPCLTCRERKKKCDRLKPNCLRCERLNLTCIYLQRGNQDNPNHTEGQGKALRIIKGYHHWKGYGKPLHIFNSKNFFAKLPNTNLLPTLNKFHSNNNWVYHLESRVLIDPRGKVIENMNPVIFIRELLGSMRRGDIVSFNDIPQPNPIKVSHPNFLVTSSLVIHLMSLYFNHINQYYPIITKPQIPDLLKFDSDDLSIQLLRNTICLCSATIIKELELSLVIKHVFSNIVFDLLKRCYNKPNIHLIQTYLLLSSLPSNEIDSPHPKPQKYYFNQAVLLIYLMGIHIKGHPLTSTPVMKLLRVTVLSSAYITETMVNSQTFEFNSTTNPEFINRSLISRTGINLLSSNPLKNLQTGFFKKVDDYPSQLHYINFLAVFYCELIGIQNTLMSSCKGTDFITQLTNGKNDRTKLMDPILKFETILHDVMLKRFNVTGTHSLTIPTNLRLTQNFILYLSCLIDLYRPYLSYNLPTDLPIDLDTHQIDLATFLPLSPDLKCLLVTSLLARSLIHHHRHSHHPLGSRLLCPHLINFQLLLQSYSLHLTSHHPLRSTLRHLTIPLNSILEEAKGRWQVTRILHKFTEVMVGNSVCEVRIEAHS